MATLIFGDDPKEIEAEWLEDGLEIKYGSIENDLMVQKWDEFEDPVLQFKAAGHYDKFKTVVHSHKVSGTFYRDVEFPLNPQPGDTFTLCMTSWTKKTTETTPKDDSYIAVLKLTCENVPGIKMRKTMILGECELEVVSRTGNLIEVRIASTE